MNRFKLPIAAVVVLVFAAISTISAKRHHQVTSLISVSLKSVGWASSELEIETLKFMQALRRATLNNIDDDELWLRFDILWSRLDVLSTGEETRPFRSQPDALLLLGDLKQFLSRIEPLLAQNSRSEAVMNATLEELERLYARVRTFNVKSFSGDRAWGSLQRLSLLQYESNFYLMGLLLSGGILIFLLYRANAENKRQARRDSLTGLANRYAFQNALAEATHRARRKKTRYAVYILDLDNFKDVNDALGHPIGDTLLRELARQLQQMLPSKMVLARLGGDEFGIIQHDIQSSQTGLELSQRICEQVSHGIKIQGHQLFPSMSIGLSIYPDHGQDPNTLTKHADTAMYQAKSRGRNTYQMFHQSMNDKAERFRILTNDLHQALADNQMTLAYQPIVCLQDRRVILVEALLRWQHDVYGAIPPPDIVTIAENSGQAERLNEWVLQTACRQTMAWRRTGLTEIQISVNISPAMHTRYNLETMVSNVLVQTGLPANKLILEITEDTTMQAVENSLQRLQNLHALGVELALDDFGTGYSSLSQLTLMPFQKLKIDKVFIQQLTPTSKKMSVLKAILTLSQDLGLKVVTEGIETEAQYELMRDAGCQYGQGYLFSKPVEATEVGKMISRDAQQRSDINTFYR
ncbi:putative bifunctional diguanylate cyclase/phosphodiesterase [Photobacterium atrarenae]|uniref:EAL domain-containing protein n=1 Tax=Photobacterium atrarenae TaxID=865757 RepID=A0ABY5GQL2_9GAMM|nr:EAL domain-containing protein [Photobacterium atrarenae]UTV31031.1 EAL domain-containing protein [Photobacterium atrarenae]